LSISLEKIKIIISKSYPHTEGNQGYTLFKVGENSIRISRLKFAKFEEYFKNKPVLRF